MFFLSTFKLYSFLGLLQGITTPQVELSKLSSDEQMKIKCGKAHFNELKHVEYRVVNNVGQLIE